MREGEKVRECEENKEGLLKLIMSRVKLRHFQGESFECTEGKSKQRRGSEKRIITKLKGMTPKKYRYHSIKNNSN